MHRTAFILTLAILAAAACTKPGPEPLSTLSLVDCAPSGLGATHAATMPAAAALRLGSGAGDDELFIPARGAPSGTPFTFARMAGAARERRVEVLPSIPVSKATVSIDVSGCVTPPGKALIIARQTASGWENVGGTRSGNKLTSNELDHLSIYAVASN